MLRFAYWAGLGGVGCSATLALLSWRSLPAASSSVCYIALFVSVFLTFAPAIMGHPARTRSGGSFSLDPSALRTAAPWTLVLAGLSIPNAGKRPKL